MARFGNMIAALSVTLLLMAGARVLIYTASHLIGMSPTFGLGG